MSLTMLDGIHFVWLTCIAAMNCSWKVWSIVRHENPCMSAILLSLSLLFTLAILVGLHITVT